MPLSAANSPPWGLTDPLRHFPLPQQFGPNEDLDKYPRTLEKDVELAKGLGTPVVGLMSQRKRTIDRRNLLG